MKRIRDLWEGYRPLWPSRILCHLFGHLDPDPNEISIDMLGVVIARACSACGQITYSVFDNKEES